MPYCIETDPIDRIIEKPESATEREILELAQELKRARAELKRLGTQLESGAQSATLRLGSREGARLRELRLAAGLTQAELARRTGIHRPNIARVEAGRHPPSLETIARLETAIGVPTIGLNAK